MIKGIIFDLDGVYFSSGKKEFVENVVTRYQIDIEKVKQVFLKSEMMYDYKKGKISGEEFWNYAIKEWNINATITELLNILQSGYSVSEEIRKLIISVKNQGIMAIICSNNFPERVKVLDKKFDFLKDFDKVILSYEHGKMKPHLYDELERITKLPKEKILVIDDDNELIKTAKLMGINTMLCDSAKEIVNNVTKLLD